MSPTDSITLLGIPWDENSSFLRGCAAAPAAVRAALASPAGNLCAESGVDLTGHLDWRDDLTLPAGPEACEAIEAAVAELVHGGTSLIALGGDHAITYPILRGLGQVHEDLTILHLDAHPDLYDAFEGNRLSHACPFARILEEGLAGRLVQIGIRAMTPHQREQAERFGVEVIEMRAWPRQGLPALTGPLYLSVDLDVLDPAFAPGLSHPEPGGMTVRDLVDLIQALPVAPVAADIVELNPSRDLGDQTARLAAKLVKEIAARMLGSS